MKFRSKKDGSRYPINTGRQAYPANIMSHQERSTRIFGPNDGKIIPGGNGVFLILDNIVYDPLSKHVHVDTAKKERDILISRGDEAIVRRNENETYQVWVRSR